MFSLRWGIDLYVSLGQGIDFYVSLGQGIDLFLLSETGTGFGFWAASLRQGIKMLTNDDQEQGKRLKEPAAHTHQI